MLEFDFVVGCVLVGRNRRPSSIFVTGSLSGTATAKDSGTQSAYGVESGDSDRSTPLPLTIRTAFDGAVSDRHRVMAAVVPGGTHKALSPSGAYTYCPGLPWT